MSRVTSAEDIRRLSAEGLDAMELTGHPENKTRIGDCRAERSQVNGSE